LHRQNIGVPGIGETGVEELEPCGRLNVGELQVGDVDQAQQRTAGTLRICSGHAEVVAYQMRLADSGLDGPVGGRASVTEHCAALKAAMRGQRRMLARHGVVVAHASSPATGTAGSELADTSTGSGRIVSATRLPAGSAVASAVES
jgi:hypothetical protein